MSGPGGERCDGCYFSERWDGKGEPGDWQEEVDSHFCRRYPPAKDLTSEGAGFFPITVAEDDWCGEFKRKLIP